MLKDIHTYVNGVLKIEIKKDTRQREYTEGRALFYKLSQELTGNSLSNIGKYMGKTHATVIHGVNKIFPLIDKNIIINAYSNFENPKSSRVHFFTPLLIENEKVKAEIKKLKAEIEVYKNPIKNKKIKSNDEFLLHYKLTNEQLIEVKERIEPIIRMIKNKVIWKPKKKIELKGAIK